MELSGAHLLVVGATGGLGGPLAAALVAAGARVSLAGRDAARLAEVATSLGEAVVTSTPVDLLDVDAPGRLVAAAAAAAPLDGVVIASGVVAFGPVAELDDDVLDELLLVNLIAPVRLVRAAAAHVRRGGVVVVLSAVVAETPLPGMAAYAASKAALTAFDRAAARELRRDGIRVLDVQPPHTGTGLAARAVAGTAPRLGTGKSVEGVVARIVRAIVDDETDLPSDRF